MSDNQNNRQDIFINAHPTKILNAVMRKLNCDADDIISATKISQSQVYRVLRVLTKTGIVIKTETRTGAGYKKRTYRTKYSKMSFMMGKYIATSFDLSELD